MAQAKTYRFEARIERAGGVYAVAIPRGVSLHIGKRGNVPVIASVKGRAGVTEVRASLVPTGGGRHKLRLNAVAREEAGAQIGDRVRLSIRVDTAPVAEPIPPDLAEALAEAGVNRDFARMPVGRQNHILAWIEKAVREETRAKRVTKTVEVTCAWREGMKGWW